MSITPLLKSNDVRSINRAIQSLNVKLGPNSFPIYAGVTLTGLTVSSLVYSNASKLLSSVIISLPLVLTSGTLSVIGLSTIGTANHLTGVNVAGTSWEYKQIVGTSNQVTVTHAANLITLSAPQDIHSGASPTFADLNLSVPVNIYGLNHNSFLNGAGNQHIDWTSASAAFYTTGTGRFDGGIGIGVAASTQIGINLSLSSTILLQIASLLGTNTSTSQQSALAGLQFRTSWQGSGTGSAGRNLVGYGINGGYEVKSQVSSTNSPYAVVAYGSHGTLNVESGESSSGSPYITTAYGYTTSVTVTRGSGASGTPYITTLYHFGAKTPILTNGTITTQYAFYSPGLTNASTNWEFYSASGNSALGGSLSIGKVTAPTVPLDVTGAALMSSTLGVTGLITATGGIQIGALTGILKSVSGNAITTVTPAAKASYNNWAALTDVVAALVALGLFDTA